MTYFYLEAFHFLILRTHHIAIANSHKCDDAPPEGRGDAGEDSRLALGELNVRAVVNESRENNNCSRVDVGQDGCRLQ